MRHSLILLSLVLAGVAHADGGPDRVCVELADCEKKCSKGDGEACLYAGMKSDHGADAGDDGSAARRFYDKSCKRKNARGCLVLARSLDAVGDASSKKKAAAAYKQAAALLDKRCKKQKDANSCNILASMYGGGQGVKQDAKKADDYMQRGCQITYNGPCPPPAPPPGPPQPQFNKQARPAQKGGE